MLGDELPKVGERVGRFKLLKLLGQGGTSAVFEAVDEQDQRSAALKIILPSVVRKVQGAAARFAREIDIARRIIHPHAVELYEYGQTSTGLPWMAMELVRGRELSELLKELGALTPERTCHLMLQVLGALADAHTMKIVHRDLKPNNILVMSTAQGEVAKVLDFGIGKAIGEGEDKKLQDVTGHFGDAQTTPHYTPPEVLKGGAASPASDVYALGLILSEMLTGEQAMAADTLFEVFAKQARQNVKLPTWLASTPLAAIILKATEKDVLKRYPDAAAMRKALQAVNARSIVAPTPAPRPVKPQAAAPLPSGPIVSSKGYGASAAAGFSLPRPSGGAVVPAGEHGLPLPRPTSALAPAHAMFEELELDEDGPTSIAPAMVRPFAANKAQDASASASNTPSKEMAMPAPSPGKASEKPISAMIATPKLGGNPLDRPVQPGIPRTATPSSPFDRPPSSALSQPLQSSVLAANDSGPHRRPLAIEPRDSVVHPTIALVGAWFVFVVTLAICILVIASTLG